MYSHIRRKENPFEENLSQIKLSQFKNDHLAGDLNLQCVKALRGELVKNLRCSIPPHHGDSEAGGGSGTCQLLSLLQEVPDCPWESARLLMMKGGLFLGANGGVRLGPTGPLVE